MRYHHRYASLLVAFLVASAAAAHGATSFFEEVASILTLSYGGAERTIVWTEIARSRATLAERCAGDDACPNEVGIEVVTALLAAFGDPHTRLLTPDAFDRVAERTVGGVAPAFGVMLHAPTDAPGWVILRTLPGGAAEGAGLQRGDRILAVDGVHPPADVAARREVWEEAAADGVLHALVLRAGTAPFTARLQATEVPLDPVPRLTLLGDVAWLEIPSLLPHAVVTPAVHTHVARAAGAGIARLIVDLRDDAGGSQLAAVGIAGAFLPRAEWHFLGPDWAMTLRFEAGVTSVQDEFGRTIERWALGESASYAGEVIVLINARTASCAEALAWALQRAGALVIGEPSAGIANAVSTVVPLTNGWGLSLTIGRVVDGQRGDIPAQVIPDVAIADDPEALARGFDAALAFAVTLP
jgi:carboxyl-terminal processing protease